MPALGRVATALVAHARVGSAARQWLLTRLFTNAFAAVNRSDVELILPGYESDVEVRFIGMDGAGFRDCYRGHEGIREMFADLDEAFGEWG